MALYKGVAYVIVPDEAGIKCAFFVPHNDDNNIERYKSPYYPNEKIARLQCKMYIDKLPREVKKRGQEYYRKLRG